jgi:hypothetical protein
LHEKALLKDPVFTTLKDMQSRVYNLEEENPSPKLHLVGHSNFLTFVVDYRPDICKYLQLSKVGWRSNVVGLHATSLPIRVFTMVPVYSEQYDYWIFQSAMQP